MRLRIDRSSREPASAQLRRQLVAAVERGWLLPGDRLPTVRELAARLGMAPNTVAKTYRDLEAEGVAEGRGRRGTFVTETPPRYSVALREAADRFVRRAADLGVGLEGALAQVREAFDRAERSTRRSGPSTVS